MKIPRDYLGLKAVWVTIGHFFSFIIYFIPEALFALFACMGKRKVHSHTYYITFYRGEMKSFGSSSGFICGRLGF